jgi:FixJ family two-component response regulator
MPRRAVGRYRRCKAPARLRKGFVPETVRPTSIAVVDDDASVRKSLGRLLRGAGFAVETYESAEAFLARGADCQPDCLVLDISLGGMSGLELRAELVQVGILIPIVFVTAHDDASTLRGLRETPETPCLRKPFDESLLFEAIGTAMGQAPPP